MLDVQILSTEVARVGALIVLVAGVGLCTWAVADLILWFLGRGR